MHSNSQQRLPVQTDMQGPPQPKFKVKYAQPSSDRGAGGLRNQTSLPEFKA